MARRVTPKDSARDKRDPGKDKERLEMVVRTVNVHETTESYGKIMLPRLYGIANTFHVDWANQIGLIGLTEPTRRIKNCMCLPPTTTASDVDWPEELELGDIDVQVPPPSGPYTATHCLAAALKDRFKQAVHHYQNKSGKRATAKDIGLIVDQHWEVEAKRAWRLGIRSGQFPDWEGVNWTWARKLAGLLLRHRGGLTVRFYCTHFTPDKGGSRKNIRRRQARRLVRKVRVWGNRNDRLPPIVVGDFNARRVYGQPAEKSVEIMEKYFWRPLDHVPAGDRPSQTSIDGVFIGRREYFPHITHTFEYAGWHRIKMSDTETDQYGRAVVRFTDDWFPKAPLTDHTYSEGFRLRIVPV